ncbi:ArsR/SmtB family transcription factor [Goodfellowiella coeruleoviolacea]|uniref:DNA-binding transcriptional regulator, ArsR family n=1 Tax=Goodfellowiella coeruleoviolacea TaxID=334858 RepID=A0AAE3GG14_9PSEU|nr:helix-turn-helix domain-containing protein [Goodfellowiella coeruleoviolacea]MCP2166689.1 DNA-binding transcriptional regulator, ArsR family [Goodfellowiella coeruleoviolacea]
MPEPRKIKDLEELKALAHPLRQRILQHLGQHGPATSTVLAKALGESSGATSYHLRMLARHGFVEEVPERAQGRERWWRSPIKDLRYPLRSEQTPEMRALVDELNRTRLAADVETFTRLQLDSDSLGDWSDALPISRGTIRVTRAELAEFVEEYVRLLMRYARTPDEAPEGARVMRTRFFAFPASADPHPRSDPESDPESDVEFDVESDSGSDVGSELESGQG